METLDCAAIWTRKPQERNDQKYFFSGRFYFTKAVFESLHFDEIIFIYQDVQDFAKQSNGIDYLQVYTDNDGRELFLIDQLDQEMIENGEYGLLHNYCTMMYANEY